MSETLRARWTRDTASSPGLCIDQCRYLAMSIDRCQYVVHDRSRGLEMTVTVPVEAPLHVPAAWRGEELARGTDWIHDLTPAEVAEIDAAVEAARARGLALEDVSRADFPLPTL